MTLPTDEVGHREWRGIIDRVNDVHEPAARRLAFDLVREAYDLGVSVGYNRGSLGVDPTTNVRLIDVQHRDYREVALRAATDVEVAAVRAGYGPSTPDKIIEVAERYAAWVITGARPRNPKNDGTET